MILEQVRFSIVPNSEKKQMTKIREAAMTEMRNDSKIHCLVFDSRLDHPRNTSIIHCLSFDGRGFDDLSLPVVEYVSVRTRMTLCRRRCENLFFLQTYELEANRRNTHTRLRIRSSACWSISACVFTVFFRASFSRESFSIVDLTFIEGTGLESTSLNFWVLVGNF